MLRCNWATAKRMSSNGVRPPGVPRGISSLDSSESVVPHSRGFWGARVLKQLVAPGCPPLAPGKTFGGMIGWQFRLRGTHAQPTSLPDAPPTPPGIQSPPSHEFFATLLPEVPPPTAKVAHGKRSQQGKPTQNPIVERTTYRVSYSRASALLVFSVAFIAATAAGVHASSEDSQLTAADQKKLEKLIQSYQAPNDPPNDVVKNFENQYRQHFESLMNAELHFAAAVCTMSTRERRFLKEASNAWLKVALREFATGQHQMQNGAGRFVIVQRNGNQIVQRRGNSAATDPSTLMVDGIQKACEAILPPDVFANYQQEIEHRAASQRTAAAQAMIVELDGQLVLTADQRERMLARLLENWDDQWSTQLPLFVQGGQFVPQIPQEIVIEILTENQKKFYARNGQLRRQAFVAPAFPAVNMNIQGRVFNIEIDD